MKKHEDNVCKKKSQTAQKIYELCIITEAFEKPAGTEFEEEFAKVKEEFLGFDSAECGDKSLPNYQDLKFPTRGLYK